VTIRLHRCGRFFRRDDGNKAQKAAEFSEGFLDDWTKERETGVEPATSSLGNRIAIPGDSSSPAAPPRFLNQANIRDIPAAVSAVDLYARAFVIR
jgi:hypothetical protein